MGALYRQKYGGLALLFTHNENDVVFQSYGNTLQVKIWGADSIVWGLGFWSGKYILGFSNKPDLDDSQGVANMIHMDN